MQHDATTESAAARMVSVAEAALALGISSEAVRMRLRRKSLNGIRDDTGHWQVELPAGRHAVERDRSRDVTNGTVATGVGTVGELADLRAERDRLLDMLEVALTERHDQPPSVLTSLRRLVATVTEWLVERLRPRDSED